MKRNDILKGGTISYDAELDHILIDGWHFVGDNEPGHEDVKMIKIIINALRRGLRKREKMHEMAR